MHDLTPRDRYLLTDEDAQKRMMGDYLNQRESVKHHVMKLPCGHGSVEVDRPEDQYLQCPTCLKHYLVTHSAVNNKVWEA